MGEVYRAYDERLDRQVAIKLVHTDRVGAGALERFLNEARMAARLSHPTIVQIYHVERFEGDDCIVMEYVEGETLSELLRKGPLSPAETLRLACELADGLAEAHRKGIIHRDLKPGNVMLISDRSPSSGRPGRARSGQAKILDFGLARPRLLEEVDYEATPEHTLIGTPGAMSPEQVQHQPADQRSDLFAFGTLLYYMATGESPFRGRTALRVLHQVCYHVPPPVDQVNPEMPAELARLISRLQEKRPEDRPQTAREVSEALVEIARTEARGLRVIVPRPPILHDERRQITVLRYTLGPETEDARAAEGVWRDVEGFNQVAAERIRRRLGCIRSEDDEGLTAFFGFPRCPEDAACRAVGVARELIACCAERFQRRREPLTLRVAVHTGVARMGERPGGGRVVFGPDARILWNVAEKLARQAEPGAVVVSGATRRLVARHFDCRDEGWVATGNGDSGMVVCRVESPVDRRGAAHPGSDGLIGRGKELKLLESRWRMAAEGRGQLVFLCGDPGIGKTRLVWALRRHLDLDSPQWLTCRCEPDYPSSPLRPVVSLLWQVLGVGRETSAEDSRARLAEVLAVRGQGSAEDVLARLLGLVGSGPLDRRQASEAVVELILALAVEKPRLWVIEDVHFMDPATLDFLGLLFEHVPASRLLLLLTFRPTFRPPWGDPTYLTRLNLGSLSHRQVEEMILARSGGRLPGALVKQIVDQVDGVPLFVEELTRAAVESVEGEGCCELRIPATLNDALMARLDRLGPDKQLAQLAAVFGDELEYDSLRAVAPYEKELLDTELERLVTAELLYRKGLKPARYVFKHTLVRKAAYESLLEDQRRGYHAEIARALELDGERIPPAVVAHHYAQAEDFERAVGYYLRAGRVETGRGNLAGDDAIRHLEEGRRLLDRLGEWSRRREFEEKFREAFLEAEKHCGAPG